MNPEAIMLYEEGPCFGFRRLTLSCDPTARPPEGVGGKFSVLSGLQCLSCHIWITVTNSSFRIFVSGK